MSLGPRTFMTRRAALAWELASGQGLALASELAWELGSEQALVPVGQA